MIKSLKLQNSEVWNEPYWVNIANEKDEDEKNDNDIYFYVEDDIDLCKIKVGDIIELDEDFEVVEI